MNSTELERLICKCLDDFYRRRLAKLSTLELKATLKRKNPYLFRARGIATASEIVEALLYAHTSSSDETIFGNAFFEPIVKAASGGTVSPSEGVDVAVETEKVYKAISVKSGPNIFNSSQSKRMNQEFLSLRSRLLKTQKQFDALLGHCYGQRSGEGSSERIYRIRSGQAFWEELTGDPNFYIKLIELMKDYPVSHRVLYQEEHDRAVNRFTREFLNDFASDDGEIDWDKLLKFNSGK